ncbi:hypothetical protein [Glutamicibacter protophormiae]|uniref:Uncharacterized protein n=1 Tax=Glutamicibacter protophormiae TaxID=37930 RepID=A0ABS4XMH9_GLUPR|nr:hypothetical protein [Glutamicibacter protophormiae]MBP2397605.1 hypothetical protein [Glutamicibacter protophormiae]GGL77846.1 hypothetical protein GCM10010038_04890 [Glutamicibacter protophormiae]
MSRADQTQTEKPMNKIVYLNEDSASGYLDVLSDSREAKIVGNLNFAKEPIDG